MILLKKIKTTGLCWLWIAVIVIVLDQVSKYFIRQSFIPFAIKPILPFLNLTLAYNRGAAFSFLSQQSGWQIWAFSIFSIVVTIGILLWLVRLPASQKWLGVALSLIVGGALGNCWDRVTVGYVTDFIQVYYAQWYFPSFNVADSAICIGAVMLLIDAMFKSTKDGPTRSYR